MDVELVLQVLCQVFGEGGAAWRANPVGGGEVASEPVGQHASDAPHPGPGALDTAAVDDGERLKECGLFKLSHEHAFADVEQVSEDLGLVLLLADGEAEVLESVGDVPCLVLGREGEQRLSLPGCGRSVRRSDRWRG